jgi:uncharacterized membrane protein
MSPGHLHLLAVHLPVVLTPVAAILLGVGYLRKSEDLVRAAYWLLVASVVAGGAAYFSGPSAFENMEAELGPVRDLVETHAVLGKAAFFGLVLLAVGSVQALLQGHQEEPTPGWLKWTLAAGTLLLCYVLAWTAHLGGQIRHPEVRGALAWLFPEL